LRHYEIVFLVHPDQSEQVPAMVERYRDLRITRELAEGRHFLDPGLPWNGCA